MFFRFARLVRERERTRNDYLNQMNERYAFYHHFFVSFLVVYSIGSVESSVVVVHVGTDQNFEIEIFLRI